MTTPCIKQDAIDDIKTRVTEIGVTQKFVRADVGEIKTDLKALAKFRSETKGEKKVSWLFLGAGLPVMITFIFNIIVYYITKGK